MVNYREIPLIVIGGPTAVGKTALSIQLAHRLNGEIINGDSLQVYRTLDIGTGKATMAEREGIPHHLLDLFEPHEVFDASQFKQLATQAIIDIYQRGKLPILVGGTGLYLEGLLYDLEFGGENSQHQAVKASLEQKASTMDALAFWQILHQKDAAAAEKIPYQNQRRVLRALEVIETTGQLFSAQDRHQLQQRVFDACILILDMPRDLLYERINRRVEMMVADGLEQEVQQLYQRYQGKLVNGVKGIGYKEWWPYFEGVATKADVIATIQQHSRRYAKRQLTWFRNRISDTHWLDSQDGVDDAIKLVQQHLAK
ncbi:tRNA (adenosine(37)-N6)-dimethylallyltransferase MiaA [Aerococcaceae bacterium zg-BR22]|uniref:tRNA (adenosine(37)-N6)-dimethylallyltransferase MiaA n=1 Tax=Aerococcaceae bacterium zg-1292 TaxID=2774330 RepID=UPI0040628935|nr:tRNA (adenosine(37)-N6)-dimethylallyltransferase MiaA [Aerococcaceae bacterium zg-BR22]